MACRMRLPDARARAHIQRLAPETQWQAPRPLERMGEPPGRLAPMPLAGSKSDEGP